jgi:serine protease Do
MKRVFINGIFAALALLTVSSAFAQDKTDKEKAKDKEDIQQIIITRKGKTDGKTIIELNGDKVLVDGKEVKDKDGDVTVRTHKIKDASAYTYRGAYVPENFNFNFDMDHNNAMNLFKEDENRAMLGVVTDDHEKKGAKITSITKETAAEKAGLKKDDIITKIDDAKIEDAEDVTAAIRKHKPGEKVSITFLRSGKEQKVTAELGKWKGIRMGADNFRIMTPDRWEGFNAPGAIFGMGGGPKLGLSVQDTEDGKGVKVVEVDEDGNAAKAGLKEDDIITHINNEEITSADAIAKEVRASREKASVQLKVLRNGKSQNIEVKIPRKLKTADL